MKDNSNSMTSTPLERIEDKLDNISDRLARIEGKLERHDERSNNHHERIMLLEASHRKVTWALVSAGFAVVIALVPILILVL